MNIDQINELTRVAYNKTADKYLDNFRDEINQKEYDRLLLDRFSGMLEIGSLICDAGCGPGGHIGRYLADKQHRVTGIDISERCIEIATAYNPRMEFKVMDMMRTGFADSSFDAVISFYSVIHTPKEYTEKIFSEFNRILKPNGKLLVVVKKGKTEGFTDDGWYEGNKVYFSNFTEDEIREHFSNTGFLTIFLDTRKPYDFEINTDRIYAIGTKEMVTGKEINR